MSDDTTKVVHDEVNSEPSKSETTSPTSPLGTLKIENVKSSVFKSLTEYDLPIQKVTKSSVSGSKRRRRGKNVTFNDCRVGFIGAGRMTEAIVRGLIEKSMLPAHIFVSSKSGSNHFIFKTLGCKTTKRSYAVFSRYSCDVIFLCLHGYVIRDCFRLGGLRPLALTTNYIPLRARYYYILSLVGGVTLQEIRAVLLNPEYPTRYRCEIHRMMLSSGVARGIGVGCIDTEIDSKKISPIVREILFKIAKLEHFPESQMDILCAVGGNGIAFVYYFLAALADGAFKMGLAKRTSIVMAAKTLGAAALTLLESGRHASDLRDACTSPSGPAIYGIAEMDRRDTSSGIAQAIEGAFRRIRDLNIHSEMQ